MAGREADPARVPTDPWAARRVADAIRQKFQVESHPSYPREWLTKRDLSPQEPAERSKGRNPEAVRGWLADEWPAIQNRGPKSTPTSP